MSQSQWAGAREQALGAWACCKKNLEKVVSFMVMIYMYVHFLHI
jgi:hypothetical protein